MWKAYLFVPWQLARDQPATHAEILPIFILWYRYPPVSLKDGILKGEARQRQRQIEFYHHKKGHFHMGSKDMNIMCMRGQGGDYKRIFGEIQ